MIVKIRTLKSSSPVPGLRQIEVEYRAFRTDPDTGIDTELTEERRTWYLDADASSMEAWHRTVGSSW